MQTIASGNQPSHWRAIYRLSSIASTLVLIIIPIQIAIYVISPIPKTIESWFLLFHQSWILGLLHQDLLYLVNNILVALMYGWSGESVKTLNDMLVSAGFEVLNDGFRVQWNADANSRADAVAFGRAIARK